MSQCACGCGSSSACSKAGAVGKYQAPTIPHRNMHDPANWQQPQQPGILQTIGTTLNRLFGVNR